MDDLFLLIDGNSLINRAYYALPPMLSEDGRPTQGVYGFVTMLLRAINDFKPTQIAVAFDLPSPTFRHACFKGYKATRKGMPDELAAQLPMLKQLLSDMGIRIFEKEGYEADDIIGTLSRCATQTVVITGDRDAFQLIDSSTRVGYTKKGISVMELYDGQRLKEDYGLSPSQIVDYKALAGDVSDNIPGVNGIGEKSALNLIEQYGNLDNIYANLEGIKGALNEKLVAGRESAYLSKKLAAIDCNAPLGFCNNDCSFSLPFPFKAKQRLVEYNINSIASRSGLFEESSANRSNLAEKKMPQIIDLQSLDGLKINEDFSFIFCPEKASIALKKIQYDIKLANNFLDWGMTKDKLAAFIVPLLNNENLSKAVFDGKTLMREFDVKINNFFDTKLALYVSGSRAETEQEFCSLYGYDDKYAAFALLNESEALKRKLAQMNQEKLYYDIELPLSTVLFDMEKRGFKLDMELNSALGLEFNDRLQKIAAEIYAFAGEEFNINSPKQLSQILFEKLKMPYPKKSKSYSTAHEILEPLSHSYPIVQKILDYRQIAKLNGTYIEGFKRLADTHGVVHTEFKQTLTTTGRLSSIEPNLQNIPVREEEGRRIRGLFIAREGYSLICADYSQIELRLLAHFSADSVMVDAFNNGRDIHAETAERVFGVKNAQTRAQSKAVNFGIIYGISDFGLSTQLSIPVYKAHEIINQYFEKFPDIKMYLDKSVDEARKNGYAETIFNRIRPLPELNSSNGQLKKFGERAAMNMPLQGSAADIIKAAMIEVEKRLKQTDAKLILQIHDELIVEAPDNQIDEVKDILISSMENIVKLRIPLKVSASVGKRWSECKG